MSLTEEQKKLRATGLGASEIATIVGLGPGSLMELYESKIHPRFDDDAGLPADLGTLLEEPIAHLYSQRTKTWLATATTFRHPTRPLILATPDRVRFMTPDALNAARALGVNDLGQLTTLDACALAERLLECKSHAARYRFEYGSPGTGVVPEQEAIQTTIQMAVTGHRIVDLEVLFRGDYGVDIQSYHVGFNESLFDWLAEAAERFWHDHIEKRVPPPADGSDRYDEALARMFPADRKPPVVADENDEKLMLDYAKFRELVRRAEVLKKQLGQKLKLRIGEAGGLVSPTFGKLSWTRSKDGTEVDWQQAANEALTLGGLVLNGMRNLNAQDAKPSDASIVELETRLREIIPAATKVKPGYRSLRLYPKKGSDADLELARLSLALDALEAGEPT